MESNQPNPEGTDLQSAVFTVLLSLHMSVDLTGSTESLDNFQAISKESMVSIEKDLGATLT